MGVQKHFGLLQQEVVTAAARDNTIEEAAPCESTQLS
jgi:hypothetical protein